MPMTVEAAIRRAWSVHEEIRLRRAQVEAARLRVSAGVWRDPEVRFAYGEGSSDLDRTEVGSEREGIGAATVPSSRRTSHTSLQSDEWNQRVGLRVFIPNPMERSARLSRTMAEFRAADAGLRALQHDVAMQIRRLFAEIAWRERDRSILDRIIAVHETAVQQVRQASAQGQATVANILDASRRQLASLSVREQAVRELARARRELAALTGCPLAGLAIDWQPAATQIEARTLDLDSLEARAFKNRADLEALFWLAKAARAAHREARATRWPWLAYVQAGFATGEDNGVGKTTSSETDTVSGWTRSGEESRWDERSDEEWRIDAALRLPLFSWSNPEYTALEAEYRSAAAAHSAALHRLTGEVRDRVHQLDGAITRRHEFGADAERLLADMERLLGDAVDASVLTYSETARIRAQMIEAERQIAEGEYAVELALIELEATLGTALREAASPPR